MAGWKSTDLLKNIQGRLLNNKPDDKKCFAYYGRETYKFRLNLKKLGSF